MLHELVYVNISPIRGVFATLHTSEYHFFDKPQLFQKTLVSRVSCIRADVLFLYNDFPCSHISHISYCDPSELEFYTQCCIPTRPNYSEFLKQTHPVPLYFLINL